jgi:uncharacterized radical SAM superfamily Fe-S cluster-containing enzyme
MTAPPGRTIIHSTVAWCVRCNTAEHAIVYAEADAIYLKRLCPKEQTPGVRIASDYDWYMKRYTRGYAKVSPEKPSPVSKGCPLDCGLCANHSNRINLPVFSITNDCNLDCPICFTYNRPDRKYFKSPDDIDRILDHIEEKNGIPEVINVTGGEPTLHPDFFEIIRRIRARGAVRLTVNTNGIIVAGNESFAERIAESGAQMVLSLNTFDPEKSRMIHGRDISGEKKRALEYFEKYDVPVTLLSVAIKNLNEDDISGIIAGYMDRKFVRTFVIQNMTFTGAHGSAFYPRERITLDDVETALAKNNIFSRDDFFPLGSSHPLCYSAAYYFVHGSKAISLTKLVDRERLIAMTERDYLLRPDDAFSREFLEGITRLWAEGVDEETLDELRSFFRKMYPSGRRVSDSERIAISEGSVKSIYIHAHMDDDTFDCARAARCGDIVPDESGAMIPACSYNLVYRERDERFWFKHETTAEKVT